MIPLSSIISLFESVFFIALFIFILVSFHAYKRNKKEEQT